MGLWHTLLGVDVVQAGRQAASDVGESDLLRLLNEDPPAWIVLTPVGGQGFILGRGNQQFSPAVLRSVGLERLLVVASESKLVALRGSPLLVDTGDQELDRELGGYVRIIAGRGKEIVYRVTSS